MDRVLRVGMLLDYYASFLTKAQREQCRLYFEEDYSLAEIAEMYNVSRQAVHDTINRAQSALEDLEEKLKLIEKNKRIGILQEKISKIISDDPTVNDELRNKLSEINDELSSISDDFLRGPDLE